MFKRGSFLTKQFYPIAVSLAVARLAACITTNGPNDQFSQQGSAGVASERYLPKPVRPSQHNLQTGVEALEVGNAKKANLAFNTAISLDTHNAALHTDNALAYQIQSLIGEGDLLDLAETGFTGLPCQE